MDKDRRLLNISEVAKFLNVKKHRAYQLAREGVIPVVRLGRQVRVDPVILDEFVRNGGEPLEGDMDIY